MTRNPTPARPGFRPRAYARFIGGVLDGLTVSMPREVGLAGRVEIPAQAGAYVATRAAGGWVWTPSPPTGPRR